MARHLKKAIDHPSVEDFINIGDEEEIVTFTIDTNSKASNTIIKDIRMPKHSMIISIIHNNKLIIPTNEYKLSPGDNITILTKHKLINDLINIF
jgi:Trk K+ transport system NAD-binding subunit